MTSLPGGVWIPAVHEDLLPQVWPAKAEDGDSRRKAKRKQMDPKVWRNLRYLNWLVFSYYLLVLFPIPI